MSELDTAALRAAYSLPCEHDGHPVYRDLTALCDALDATRAEVDRLTAERDAWIKGRNEMAVAAEKAYARQLGAEAALATARRDAWDEGEISGWKYGLKGGWEGKDRNPYRAAAASASPAHELHGSTQRSTPGGSTGSLDPAGEADNDSHGDAAHRGARRGCGPWTETSPGVSTCGKCGDINFTLEDD